MTATFPMTLLIKVVAFFNKTTNVSPHCTLMIPIYADEPLSKVVILLKTSGFPPGVKPKGESVVTQGFTPCLYVLYYLVIGLTGPYIGPVLYLHNRLFLLPH